MLAKDILGLESKGNAGKIKSKRPERTRINRQIAGTKHDHPIRVYSALLEFNDATALKMYHKLHNIMVSKKEKSPKKADKAIKDDNQKQEPEDFMSYLQNEEEIQTEANLNDFG